MYYSEMGFARGQAQESAAHHSPTGRLIGLGIRQLRFVVLGRSLRRSTSSAFHRPSTDWQCPCGSQTLKKFPPNESRVEPFAVCAMRDSGIWSWQLPPP